MEVPVADAHNLQESALAGYLDGLRDAGWHGDPDLVRSGYEIAARLRYGVGLIGLLPAYVDERRPSWLEQISGRPLAEVVAGLAAVNRWQVSQIRKT
jgi:hypothetical protein